MIAVYALATLIAVGMILVGIGRGMRDADRIEQRYTPRHAPASPRPDEPDEFPTYEAGVPVDQFPAGIEADIVQGLRDIAEGYGPMSPDASALIRRRLVAEVRPVDELAVRHAGRAL